MSVDLNSLRIDPSLKNAPAATTRPWRWWAVAAASVAAVVLFLFARAPAAVDVEVVRVAAPVQSQAGDPGDVVLNATGYIIAAHKIALAPKVVGRVAWIGVDMGDKVHKGDVLVRLEDDEYRARVLQQEGQLDAAKARLEELENGSRPEEVAQAQAELDQTAADLQNATNNVKRNRELVGTNAVSEQAIDDAEAKFSLTKAKVDAARAALELVKIGPRKEQIAAQRGQVEQMQGMLDLVKVDLANTVIRAPVDGTVLERNVEVGEYVTTGFVGDRGAKGYVVSLADLNDLRVELDISQSDFFKVALDQRCTVTTDAYPDRRYAGVVNQIAPEANRQKATVLVKVKIVNPDDLLRPDMNASVAFHPRLSSTQPTADGVANAGDLGATHAVVVPATAVRDGNVFVVEAGKAVARPVQVGQNQSDGVRITHGLAGGEMLIVDPPATLTPGRAVRATEQSGAVRP